MALDAGTVAATLEGRLDKRAFNEFGKVVYKARADMEMCERGIADSTRRTNTALTAMGSAAKTAGAVVATAGAVGVAALAVETVKAVKEAAKFEAAMRNVNSIAKLSEVALKGVSKEVLAMGGRTGQAPKVLAEGLYDIVSSGFEAKDGLKILEVSARAATAGLTDTATSTKAVVAVLNSYKLGAEDAGEVSDQLFQIVKQGVISFPELASQIGDVLPFASSLGIGLDQLGGAIATITKGGVNASQTMTQVKGIFNQMLSPSVELKKAIKETGESSAEALLNHRGLEGALDDLVGTTDGSKAAIQRMFPDVEALGGVLRLTGDNAKGARDDLAAMAEASGSTQAAFAEQSKSYEVSAQKFGAAWKAAQITVGEQVLPVLTKKLGEWSKGLSEAIESGKLERIGQNLADGTSVALDSLEALAHSLDKVSGRLDELSSGGGLEDALAVDPGGLASDIDEIASAISNVISTFHLLDTGKALALGPLQQLSGLAHAAGSALRGDLSGAIDGLKSSLAGSAKAFTAPFAAIPKLIEVPFRSAADTILGLLSSVLSGTAEVVGTMADIPVIGDKFQGFAAGIEAAADGIDALREGINDVKPPPPVLVDVETEAATAALKRIEGSKLETKVVRVLGQDTDARTKLNALKALGIPPKTAKVLAAVADALSGLGSVAAMLRALQDKTITVTTVQKTFKSYENRAAGAGHAAGRPPGARERALVGEGGGPEWVVDPARGSAFRADAPVLVDLPPTAYVIPTEPRYRERGQGLLAEAMAASPGSSMLMAIARDIGVPGYKKGRAPAKKKPAAKAKAPRDLPGDVQPTALPLEDIDKKRDAAKTAMGKADTTVKSTSKAIKTKRRQVDDIKDRKPKTAAAKADKAKDLRRAQDDLAELRAKHDKAVKAEKAQRAAFKVYDDELQKAKKYQALIDRQTSAANTAASDMRAADGRDDQGGYDDAKKRRLGALRKLEDLLTRAKAALKDQDSAAVDALQEQISSTGADIVDTSDQLSQAESAAAREAEEPDLTAAQKAILARDEKSIALAALTETLDDDKAAADQLVADLEGFLGSLTSGAQPATDSLITDIAGRLKAARDNVVSLAQGKSADANLQARLDQANERRRVSDENARINAQALAVFGGSGDIGAGGRNAMQAATGPTVNVYTLHPGDERTLAAIGAAATAGIDAQGARQSPRRAVG